VGEKIMTKKELESMIYGGVKRKEEILKEAQRFVDETPDIRTEDALLLQYDDERWELYEIDQQIETVSADEFDAADLKMEADLDELELDDLERELSNA
jgi:hypothetical protein